MAKPKYATVIGQLPKFSGVEPDRRAVVDVAKAMILEDPHADEQPVQTNDVTDALAFADRAMRKVIAAEKRTTAGRTNAAEFARAYSELRRVKHVIDGWLGDVNLLVEAYGELMVDRMEAEGVTGMRLADGRAVSTYAEPYATVKDREAFRLWCLANGYEHQLTLPWQTVNALAKERLLAGESEPDGVETFAKMKIRLGSE